MAETLPDVGQPPILIVDDDASVLEILGGQIAFAGYRAVAFTNPREAFEALRRTEFAAVISDFRMPEMSGIDLLARVREIQPGAMRILVTGVLSTESLLGSIESGLLHRFLPKPWARVDLVAAVESAIRHHSLLSENQRLRDETSRLSDALKAANAKVEVMLEQLTRRDAPRPSSVHEVDASDLQPGMRLARSVTSPSGLLLLDAGDELTPAAIARLRSPGSLAATAQRLLIYERRATCG